MNCMKEIILILKKYYTKDQFGHSMVYGSIYSLSAGISHSAQYALAAIFKAANNGELKFCGSS